LTRPLHRPPCGACRGGTNPDGTAGNSRRGRLAYRWVVQRLRALAAVNKAPNSKPRVSVLTATSDVRGGR